MKRIMLFIACMALLGLCNAQRGYRITGNLGQLQQDTFYLVVPNLNGTVNVLGVSILKEGNLEFAGQVPEPVMATIMTSAGNDPVNVGKYRLFCTDWNRVY